MSPEDIKGAFAERLNAVNELRALVDDTNGEFDGEQESTFERLNKSIDDLDRRVNNGLTALEQNQRAEDAAERFLSLGDLTATPEAQADTPTVNETDIIRQLVTGELRSYHFGGSEQRDLLTTSTAAGGAVVPTRLFDRVIARLYDEGAALQAGATVLNTEGSETLTIPQVTAESSAALIVESGSVGESDPTFATVSLAGYKLGALVDISHELAMSQGVNGWSLEDYIGDELGRAIGRKAGDYFATGTGSSQPHGYAVAAATGKTNASATAITISEIIDLMVSVIPAYRNADSAFVANDAVWAYVRKLVDSDGGFLWSPSVQAGQPDSILGHRVLSETNMSSAITTGKTTMVFGDFSRFYVRFSMGLRIDSTIYDKFTTDMTSIRGLLSVDSVLTDTNALKKMVQA